MSAPLMSTTRMSRGDWLCALAVIVIWGLNFVVMKLGLETLSPMVLGALRFMVASLPFVLLVRPPKMPWGYVVAYGLAQGLGQFGLLFLGLRLGMTAGMASVVMQTQAFFTVILAVSLLGERAKPSQWWGLVLAFAGLIVIAAGRGEGTLQMTLAGFVLTLGAAFMWAVSNLVARKASQVAPGYAPLPFIVWSSLVPIVPFWLLAWALEGTEGIIQQLQAADGKAVFAVVYLALLATVPAYSLWTRLLQRHTAARVTPYSLMVPVVGLMAAMLILGEQPTAMQWLGTAAVIGGMLVNQFGSWWRWPKAVTVSEKI